MYPGDVLTFAGENHWNLLVAKDQKLDVVKGRITRFFHPISVVEGNLQTHLGYNVLRIHDPMRTLQSVGEKMRFLGQVLAPTF